MPLNDFFQIDLADIKAEYEKIKGIPLKQVIEDRLKGDLEKLLLQILGDWETIFFPNQFNHIEARRHEIWIFLFVLKDLFNYRVNFFKFEIILAVYIHREWENTEKTRELEPAFFQVSLNRSLHKW